MMKKWQIVTIVVTLLIIVVAGRHIGTRWNVIHKLNKNPKMKHRVAVVPTELDLSNLQSKTWIQEMQQNN